MRIQEILPQESSTGENEQGYKISEDFETKTQKQKISTLAELYSGLASKTASVGELMLLKDEIIEIKDEANKSLRIMERTRDLVFFGFFVLLVMVVTMLATYMEFVYSGSKNDDYKYSLSIKVSDIENQMKSLKECLDVSKWLNPKCFAN